MTVFCIGRHYLWPFFKEKKKVSFSFFLPLFWRCGHENYFFEELLWEGLWRKTIFRKNREWVRPIFHSLENRTNPRKWLQWGAAKSGQDRFRRLKWKYCTILKPIGKSGKKATLVTIFLIFTAQKIWTRSAENIGIETLLRKMSFSHFTRYLKIKVASSLGFRVKEIM